MLTGEAIIGLVLIPSVLNTGLNEMNASVKGESNHDFTVAITGLINHTSILIEALRR